MLAANTHWFNQNISFHCLQYPLDVFYSKIDSILVTSTDSNWKFNLLAVMQQKQHQQKQQPQQPPPKQQQQRQQQQQQQQKQ